MQIHYFTFNPFQENTYVLYDATRECIIVDPGCYSQEEKNELVRFITNAGLTPVKLVLSHGHIDHILGNSFIAGRYGLKVEMHAGDAAILKSAPVYGEMWGVRVEPSPDPSVWLKEGDEIRFGSTVLKIIFTPGHSPGSVCLYNEADRTLIGGDVLFFESIGRTDLPGGDPATLLQSIRSKLFTLPDEVRVFPGHGPDTTIGYEKQNNPFLQG